MANIYKYLRYHRLLVIQRKTLGRQVKKMEILCRPNMGEEEK